MRCYILLGLLYLSAYLFAQKKQEERIAHDGWDVYMKVGNPITQLSEAAGWIYDSVDDNWLDTANEIKGIDNFGILEFGIASLDRKIYLYLKKTYTQIYNYHDELNPQKRWSEESDLAWIYILDLEQYKQEVLSLSDSYNVLYLDIMTDSSFKNKQKDIYPQDITESPIYERRRNMIKESCINRYQQYLTEAKASEDKKKIKEYSKLLHNCTLSYRDKNKLIIKFNIDNEREKVQFFIFRADNDRYIPENNFFKCRYPFDAIQLDNALIDIMWSDAIFDFFHYEVDYDKFIDFINGPLDYG